MPSPSSEPEIAATRDPGGGPPGRVDAAWLILQRLDDIRREQDVLKQVVTRLQDKIDALETRLRQELRQEIAGLRQEIAGPWQGLGDKHDRLVNWLPVGLLAIVVGLWGIAATVVGLVLQQ